MCDNPVKDLARELHNHFSQLYFITTVPTSCHNSSQQPSTQIERYKTGDGTTSSLKKLNSNLLKMQKLKVALSHLRPGPLLSCAADEEWAKVTFSNHNKQVM